MRILVHGHLGMGNLGDEAMLQTILALLTDRFPDTRLIVAVGPSAPQPFLRAKNIEVVARNVPRLLWEILRCRAFVIAGGTHLASFNNDQRHRRGILRQLLLVLFARLTFARVFMLSVGFGPFEDHGGERLAKWILHLTHFVSVRDEASETWLRTIKYPSHYRRCHDAAIFLDRAKSCTAGPRLGISLMPYHANYSGNQKKDGKLVEALVPVVKAWRAIHPNGEVCLCSFLKQDSIFSDSCVLLPLKERFQNADWVTLLDDSPDLVATCKQFATFTHFISMRYHSQVLARLHDIPQLCLIYHRKNRTYAHEYGIPDAACFGIEKAIAGGMQATAEEFFRDSLRFAATSHLETIGANRDDIFPSDAVCLL